METEEAALRQLLAAVIEGQARAIATVNASSEALLAGARLMAAAWRGGGRVIYLGVGASGGVALQDFAEQPGTFGIPPSQLVFISSDTPGQAYLGNAEDDLDAGARTMANVEPIAGDIIIAVTASGTTRFTLGAAAEGKRHGARIVSLTCTKGSPLQTLADVAIVTETGNEAVTGSTRLAAGTAHKAALGAMSTLAGAMLGHIYRGHMVNMRASNAKLRERALTIVFDITGVSRVEAERALQATNLDVKAAILSALGAPYPTLLNEACGGDLATAIMGLGAVKAASGPAAQIQED